MSIYKYLQLQPVEPTDDGTVSPLDDYAQDETIDLTRDPSEQELDAAWDRLLEDFKNDPDKLNFSDSDK